MNRVMKRVNGVMLASLLAFNANAGEPELWQCKSTNMSKPTSLFLIYRKSTDVYHDFMLFSSQGGLLGLGSLDILPREDFVMLSAKIQFPSGMREMYLSPVKEPRGVLMQIFSPDGTAADIFLCN